MHVADKLAGTGKVYCGDISERKAEKIMENALEEEPIEIVTYEQKMEEQTSVNIKIAEKKEMWEPVKRLLEKTKRERWGRWEGL